MHTDKHSEIARSAQVHLLSLQVTVAHHTLLRADGPLNQIYDKVYAIGIYNEECHSLHLNVRIMQHTCPACRATDTLASA